jgi:hypothetical protein
MTDGFAPLSTVPAHVAGALPGRRRYRFEIDLGALPRPRHRVANNHTSMANTANSVSRAAIGMITAVLMNELRAPRPMRRAVLRC